MNGLVMRRGSALFIVNYSVEVYPWKSIAISVHTYVAGSYRRTRKICIRFAFLIYPFYVYYICTPRTHSRAQRLI